MTRARTDRNHAEAIAIADGRSKTPACPYCGRPDATWEAGELLRGKRGLHPPPGVEYHCIEAFYGAS